MSQNVISVMELTPHLRHVTELTFWMYLLLQHKKFNVDKNK